MLLKNPLQRMTKFSQIKNHPYFSDFNFENLLAFNFTPPHMPKIDHKDLDVKPITFAHYMKTSLIEYKIPTGFSFDKKQIAEFSSWYKNF